MLKIKMLTAEQALKMAAKVMDSKGFMRHKSSSSNSVYFTKRGYPHRIRFSDHKVNNSQSDVIHFETFDGATIENDVIYRVNRSIDVFERFYRNLNRKLV